MLIFFFSSVLQYRLVEVLGSLGQFCKLCSSFKTPQNFSGCIFYYFSAKNAFKLSLILKVIYAYQLA